MHASLAVIAPNLGAASETFVGPEHMENLLPGQTAVIAKRERAALLRALDRRRAEVDHEPTGQPLRTPGASHDESPAVSDGQLRGCGGRPLPLA